MMLDFQVRVSTTHESIKASKIIGINDRASADSLNGQVEQSLRTDILENFYPNDAVPFKNPENRNFSGRFSPSIAFSPASEVSFIQFDLSSKQVIALSVIGCNTHPDRIDCFEDSRIIEATLLVDLPGRELQFKELNNPKPISATNPKVVNPASGEIMEIVFTQFTSKPFAADSVDLVAATFTAETTVVFPT